MLEDIEKFLITQPKPHWVRNTNREARVWVPGPPKLVKQDTQIPNFWQPENREHLSYEDEIASQNIFLSKTFLSIP